MNEYSAESLKEGRAHLLNCDDLKVSVSEKHFMRNRKQVNGLIADRD